MTQPGPPPPTDAWRAITPEESVGSTPPMPGWVKPVLAVGAVLLASVGGLVGANLGMPDEPEPLPSPSPSPTPAVAMEPPLVVDALVRGQASTSNGPAPANQQIVQADYTDGEHTVVFVMTWPEPDVTAFLENAGIGSPTETAPESGTYCGVSEDTGQPACGEVVDEVGLLLVSVSDQSESAVAASLDRFKEELGQ